MADQEWEQVKLKCIPLKATKRVAGLFADSNRHRFDEEEEEEEIEEVEYRWKRVEQPIDTITRMRIALAPISRSHPLGGLIGAALLDWHRAPSGKVRWGTRRKQKP